MGMFSEFAHASAADYIARHIIKSIEENPQDKEVILKYLMPVYEEECGDAWGSQNKDLQKQLQVLNKS